MYIVRAIYYNNMYMLCRYVDMYMLMMHLYKYMQITYVRMYTNFILAIYVYVS